MTQEVVQFDNAAYQASLETVKTVVVRFWAPWCMPCRKMAPIFSKVAAGMGSESVMFGEVDVDNYPGLASPLGVRSIPTVVVFREGKEVARSAGLIPAQEVEALVRQAL